MTTRQQYEKEISRLNSLIRKAQEKYNYEQGQNDSNQRSHCAGFDAWCGKGLTCCDKWKSESQQAWNKNSIGLSSEIENAKNNLWDYQKRIAQEEQDAQVKAVREAIAEQVRLEQKKIQQQQSITIQETVIPEPRIIEPPKRQTENNLLPLAVVAGVLLL